MYFMIININRLLVQNGGTKKYKIGTHEIGITPEVMHVNYPRPIWHEHIDVRTSHINCTRKHVNTSAHTADNQEAIPGTQPTRRA